jgi:hypothetical protein
MTRLETALGSKGAWTNSLLESSNARRVGARGLQDCTGHQQFCRPGALTGRTRNSLQFTGGYFRSLATCAITAVAV